MSTPTDGERCPKCHIAYECGCDCTPTDEPRELARRWAYNEAGMPVYGSEAIADPEPLDDPERERLFMWVREAMVKSAGGEAEAACTRPVYLAVYVEGVLSGGPTGSPMLGVTTAWALCEAAGWPS